LHLKLCYEHCLLYNAFVSSGLAILNHCFQCILDHLPVCVCVPEICVSQICILRFSTYVPCQDGHTHTFVHIHAHDRWYKQILVTIDRVKCVNVFPAKNNKKIMGFGYFYEEQCCSSQVCVTFPVSHSFDVWSISRKEDYEHSTWYIAHTVTT